MSPNGMPSRVDVTTAKNMIVLPPTPIIHKSTKNDGTPKIIITKPNIPPTITKIIPAIIPNILKIKPVDSATIEPIQDKHIMAGVVTQPKVRAITNNAPIPAIPITLKIILGRHINTKIAATPNAIRKNGTTAHGKATHVHAKHKIYRQLRGIYVHHKGIHHTVIIIHPKYTKVSRVKTIKPPMQQPTPAPPVHVSTIIIQAEEKIISIMIAKPCTHIPTTNISVVIPTDKSVITAIKIQLRSIAAYTHPI